MAIVVGVVVLLGGAALGAFLVFGPKYLDQADLERQLTEAGRGFASAAQSASCPADLRAEKDRTLDCTVRLADGSEVPAKVTVTSVDGDQATFTRQIAVLAQSDLEDQLSADVAKQYKAIPMTCAGDLVGLQGKMTTCEGADASGGTIRVRAAFAKLGPNLEVAATFTPYVTAEDVATELETRILANTGSTITVTCDADLEGKVGATTTCEGTDATGTTSMADIAVESVTSGYVINFNPQT